MKVKWVFTTLLAVVAVGVLVRLGFWQLDRLDQRRAFNARVQEQLDQPQLDLDASSLASGDLAARLPGMEYRAVKVTGEYDFTRQVALRNQAWNNQLGVRLLTPLHIQGSDKWVLVDRGWIPYDDFTAGALAQYDQPGAVTVTGMIRRSQSRPDFGRRSDPTPAPGSRLDALYMANLSIVAQQSPYSLLPVYIQQSPDPAKDGLPHPSVPELDLTEGPHMGYAIQWFAFAAILAIGYPVFVKREISERGE